MGFTTRRLNRQRVLDVVLRRGPISRADLAKRTRLSPPTVSALVDELVNDAGLLKEVGIGPSSGGRPPVMLASVARTRTPSETAAHQRGEMLRGMWSK